jgi:hypothetical protein
MESLILGRPSAERTRVSRLLADAGYVVEVCHEQHWSCVGLDDHCPIDGRRVDVAVAVAEPSGRFDPQGITCVHRSRIPIVVVGATDGDPVLQYATTQVSNIDHLVQAVRAAASVAPGHHDAVRASLAEHLSPGETVSVALTRKSDGIEVMLSGDLTTERSATLADVARAAVRAHDPKVSTIDISVVSSTPHSRPR